MKCGLDSFFPLGGLAITTYLWLDREILSHSVMRRPVICVAAKVPIAAKNASSHLALQKHGVLSSASLRPKVFRSMTLGLRFLVRPSIHLSATAGHRKAIDLGCFAFGLLRDWIGALSAAKFVPKNAKSKRIQNPTFSNKAKKSKHDCLLNSSLDHSAFRI